MDREKQLERGIKVAGLCLADQVCLDATYGTTGPFVTQCRASDADNEGFMWIRDAHRILSAVVVRAKVNHGETFDTDWYEDPDVQIHIKLTQVSQQFTLCDVEIRDGITAYPNARVNQSLKCVTGVVW
jgi:hypothetical protein